MGKEAHVLPPLGLQSALIEVLLLWLFFAQREKKGSPFVLNPFLLELARLNLEQPHIPAILGNESLRVIILS